MGTFSPLAFGMRATFVMAGILVLGACQNPNTGSPQPSGGPPGAYQPPAVNFDAEINMLRDAVKIDPGNVNAWIGLGNKTMDAGRYQEAVEAYEKALEFDSSNVNVRVDMGTCYRRIGQPERAVTEYRKALELQPEHAYANLNLGVVLYHDLNDPQGALVAWEKFLTLQPDHPSAPSIRNEVSKIKAMTPGKG